jgi:hypothetical protein
MKLTPRLTKAMSKRASKAYKPKLKRPDAMIRPKAMVRPKAKLWPKAVIRPKAKLQPKAMIRPKAMVKPKAKSRPKAKLRPKANDGKLFILIALMIASPSFLIIHFLHSPSQNILQSLQK